MQKVQKVHIFIKSCKLNLPEKEERAAFGKRLKRKEAWTAEYRLKQNTAALNGSFLHDQVDQVLRNGQVGRLGYAKIL